MDDIEKLLLNACKPGLCELTKQGVGLYDAADDEGIHYLINGKYYLVTVKKEEEDEKK